FEEFPSYSWIFSSKRFIIAFSFSTNHPLAISVHSTVTAMCLPLVLLIVPIAFHGLSILTRRSTPVANNIIFCIQLLHAPLHSILLIVTTSSYREAFIR
ncbi:hypothetical protein PMAYCL1PPCAC_30262, partial [Pristionchus mayeri]